MSRDERQEEQGERSQPLPEQNSARVEMVKGDQPQAIEENEDAAVCLSPDEEMPETSSAREQHSKEDDPDSSAQRPRPPTNNGPENELTAPSADVKMEESKETSCAQQETTESCVEADAFRFEEPDSDDSDYGRDMGTRSCLEISRETEMDFEWTKYANDINCFNIEDSQFMGGDEPVETVQSAGKVSGLKPIAMENLADGPMYEPRSGVADTGEGNQDVPVNETSEMPRKSEAGLAFARKTIRILKNRCTVEVLNELLDEALGIVVDQRLTARLLKCQTDLQDLRSRAMSFLESEKQDLRVLRMVLNDLERFPIVTEEEEKLKELWKSASAWLERARVILSFPRKTRKCRRSSHERKSGITMQDLVSLINEGNEIKVLKSRREWDQIKRCVLDIHQWSAAAHETIQSNDPTLDRCQELLSRLEDLVVEPENAAELKKTLWRLQAQSAVDKSVDVESLRKLAYPTDFGVEDPAIQDTLQLLRAKLEAAEDWIERAKNS
ncbi:hypothetical protein GUITHDRAFT_99644 [Guillardia theta CCMP2712]|uniref:Lysine-specific demethylase-like domain-containing protein n=1 Tax=Guillardia theta (strain CCMP2712) TaxID=905079 RepID=L1K336_GUITC|nr:hypothetical protein GUITHDRAFT_99644 [Guillardia theta CCMP2712]EKX55002.1 hypothetical protein GUITHDRAFT_99644 [Guillardia theta CCMP2712]|eukprot:XP_005841982.1 hypothetical protein GUITHDRAFT_99644 [Guillardia theta CCMP2712]